MTRIVIIEVAEPHVDEIGKLFTGLKIPDVVYVLVPKEAQVKIADTVAV